MKTIIAFLLLVFAPSLVLAQGAMLQYGTVTSGHAAKWIQNGAVMDGGGAAGGPVGTGLSEIGVTNSGLGICDNSGPTTSVYSSVCVGFVSGVPTLSVSTTGTPTTPIFQFVIDGTAYSFPFSGSGAVVGPETSAVGALATWNNTTGTLLASNGPLSALAEGGSLPTTNISSAEPANAVALTSGGARTSYCSILGCVDTTGDHQRATGLFIATTQIDGQVQENTVGIETTVTTGRQVSYSNSLAVTVGQNIVTNGTSHQVYRVTVAGTTASSGSGPSCAGEGVTCTDGSATFLWINAGALDAKLGIYNAVNVTPTGGAAWTQANNLNVASGAQNYFFTNTEMDVTNYSGDCVVGTSNCYGLFMGMGGSGTNTAWIAFSGSGENPNPSIYQAHYGIWLFGNQVAKDADINDTSSGAVGIYFNLNNTGANHSTATIVDSSTGPVSYLVNAAHTGATFEDVSVSPISLSIGTGVPVWAASTYYGVGSEVQNLTNTTPGLYKATTAGTSASSGTGPQGTGSSIADGTVVWQWLSTGQSHSIAAILDNSIAPKAISLTGWYTIQTVSDVSVSPISYAVGGKHSLAGIFEGSVSGIGIDVTGTYVTAAIDVNGATAPIGINISGTFSTYQLAGTNFSFSPTGQLGFAPSALTGIPATYACFNSAGGLISSASPC